MGDLFFIARMSVYTVFIVLFMQVKIGSGTIEDRVIQFTHQSQFASLIKDYAGGAVTFIGNQYNRLVRDVDTRFTRKHSDDQIPGKRLQAKLKKIKESFQSEATKAGNQVVDELGQVMKPNEEELPEE